MKVSVIIMSAAIVVVLAAIVIVICCMKSSDRKARSRELNEIRKKALDEELGNNPLRKKKQPNGAMNFIIRGQVYTAPMNESVKIGRTDDNDIAINDKGISRHHCIVYAVNNAVVIEDLNSSNGTLIKRKGKVLQLKAARMQLFSEDVIILGNEAIGFNR